MATWREEIIYQLNSNNESWDDIIAKTKNVTDKTLDKKFDGGWGGDGNEVMGDFLIWTKNRIYFPTGYDGASWVMSIPRNPREEADESYFL